MQQRSNQKGSVMLEFALAGVVSITALFSTVQMCLGVALSHAGVFGARDDSESFRAWARVRNRDHAVPHHHRDHRQ